MQQCTCTDSRAVLPLDPKCVRQDAGISTSRSSIAVDSSDKELSQVPEELQVFFASWISVDSLPFRLVQSQFPRSRENNIKYHGWGSGVRRRGPSGQFCSSNGGAVNSGSSVKVSASDQETDDDIHLTFNSVRHAAKLRKAEHKRKGAELFEMLLEVMFLPGSRLYFVLATTVEIGAF